jgi:hypothetical protein
MRELENGIPVMWIEKRHENRETSTHVMWSKTIILNEIEIIENNLKTENWIEDKINPNLIVSSQKEGKTQIWNKKLVKNRNQRGTQIEYSLPEKASWESGFARRPTNTANGSFVCPLVKRWEEGERR